MIKYPHKLEKIFTKLHKNGIKAIIVGGYVRDYFLATPSKDIDIEVYNIHSFEKLEEVLEEFGSVNSVGKSFGVCKLLVDDLDLDFSFPREDNKIGVGHKGFDVSINSNLDYKTASSRRDFTINAIGFDTQKKEILDPFNGLDDLKTKTLRAIDAKKFQEDPLRVLRGIQFCARFNLKIDKKLFELCKKMVDKKMLNELSKERVFGEIQKLLLKAKKPSNGLKLMQDLHIIKGISGLKLLTQREFLNTTLIIDEIAKLSINNKTKITLMLSFICYSFERKNSTDLSLSQEFIMNYSDEKELLKHILLLVENYIFIKNTSFCDIDDYYLYKLATKVKISELILLAQAHLKVNKNSEYSLVVKKIEKKAKKLNILEEKMPQILQGKDILKFGMKPSKEFSKILSDAYTAQMKKTFTSHIDATKWLKKYLKQNTYID